MPEFRVRNIAKRFGSLDALRDATFTAVTGEVVGLFGPNGAGKSTLLACVAGLLAVDAGEVTRDNAVWPVQHRRDGMFFLPDGIAPWGDHSVRWLLSFGRSAFGSADHATVARIADSLRTDELLSRPMRELSKGQRKRVLLAAALSSSRELVLMDEPFDGLDVRQTRDAIALLRFVASTGRAIVASIHSASDAERACDRVAMLHNGRVIAEGSPEQLKRDANVVDGALEEVFLAIA